MAASGVKKAAPLALVHGEEDFAVKQRAREIYQQWCADLGGTDHEIIDAAVANSGEALRAIGRLREALQTLPFFGSAKAIWFRGCTFLGEDRVASSGAVTEALADLAGELKSFDWKGVRLLVSATKVDRRKAIYKALDHLGSVEGFAAWTPETKNWAGMAEQRVLGALKAREKEIGDEALAELVNRIGPHPQQLDSEAEKLALYVGARREIDLADVNAVCGRNKNARAFALADALGDRDLPALLRRLDEELWEIRQGSDGSEIGLLYGLISKVRAMLLLKEMLREGWVKPEANYDRFKAQVARVPAEELPQDRRFNPLALNPFVLFRALPQVRRYSEEELVHAMEVLLESNRRLVTSKLDKVLVLQQALVEIAGCKPTTRAR